MGHKVKLKLGSRIAYVDLVHEMAEELARKASFPHAAALDIALAVREAFINAVKHGNALDPGKTVEVEFASNATSLRILVRDQGVGFEWQKTRDPREEENIARTGGRGIFFMKHFVDRVDFTQRPGKGMEVLLEKQLEPVARSGVETKRRRG